MAWGCPRQVAAPRHTQPVVVALLPSPFFLKGTLRVLHQSGHYGYLAGKYYGYFAKNYYGQSYGYFEQITIDFLGRFGAQIRKV